MTATPSPPRPGTRPPATPPPGARPPGTRLPGTRLPGVDVARALAILGMFVAHLGWPEDPAGTAWFWIFDGRSSALFALLAGTGLGFMTARADTAAALRTQRVRIAKRAGVLYLLGWALVLLGTPVAVILPAYAVMFLLMLPVLRWPPRALFALAGVVVLLGPPLVAAIRMAFAATLGVEGLAPAGVAPVPVLGDLATGYYPALTWVAYLLVGLALARLDLARRATQWWMLAAGAAVAVAAYGSGLALERALEPDPYTLVWALVSVEPHADSAFEVIGNAGTATAVLAACLLLTSLTPVRVATWPLAALGSMSLTIYAAHIVAIRILGSDAVWYPDSNLPLVWMILGALAFAALWRATLGQGPLERLLHRITRARAAPE